MITRHRIATVLTTTAIAYSICSPAQAVGIATVTRAQMREPVADDRDRGLQQDIKSALGADDELSGCQVAITARGGRVTLSGRVPDAGQLARVLQTTMSVPGVRGVDNALEITER